MRIVEIVVQAGTPQVTLCSTCQIDAYVTVDMYVLGVDGPTRIGTSTGCAQCRTGFFEDQLDGE